MTKTRDPGAIVCFSCRNKLSSIQKISMGRGSHLHAHMQHGPVQPLIKASTGFLNLGRILSNQSGSLDALCLVSHLVHMATLSTT